MPVVSIIFGLLLSGLGGYAYGMAEYKSFTALVPAYFGVPLILLGLVALNENYLKHAMHAAALVGVIGVVAGAVFLTMLINKGEPWGNLKWQSGLGLGVLSALFVGFCVNSFIQARLRRAERERLEKEQAEREGLQPTSPT